MIKVLGIAVLSGLAAVVDVAQSIDAWSKLGALGVVSMMAVALFFFHWKSIQKFGNSIECLGKEHSEALAKLTEANRQNVDTIADRIEKQNQSSQQLLQQLIFRTNSPPKQG